MKGKESITSFDELIGLRNYKGLEVIKSKTIFSRGLYGINNKREIIRKLDTKSPSNCIDQITELGIYVDKTFVDFSFILDDYLYPCQFKRAFPRYIFVKNDSGYMDIKKADENSYGTYFFAMKGLDCDDFSEIKTFFEENKMTLAQFREALKSLKWFKSENLTI